MTMSLEEIESAITQLLEEKLVAFRAWYDKFDSDAWDEQIASDVKNGKLDALANAALAEYKAGKSRNYNAPCILIVLGSL